MLVKGGGLEIYLSFSSMLLPLPYSNANVSKLYVCLLAIFGADASLILQ